MFAVMFSGMAMAQKTEMPRDPRRFFREGLTLFEKEKYGAAQEAFTRAIAMASSPYDEIAAESEYYYALCAIELFNKDAEARITQFAYKHSEHPKAAKVPFELALYHFRNKNYRKAAQYFEQCDVYDLTDDEVGEYYFKNGYSLFAKEHFDEASRNFFQVKNSGSVYAPLAKYYHAHIAYTQGNNETALEEFMELRDDPNFAPVVPYYISQIYYLQRRNEELIAYATPLLDSVIPKREAEIARLLGEAYYRTGRFKEAVPYLEKFQEKSYFASREDLYQLGYAYYKSMQWEPAVNAFKQIVSVNDSLTQYAYYHLGDAYYKSDQKTYAQNAFAAASRMNYDPDVTENALYNYAKLSYELSYNPYNRAIYAFRDYLNKYPKSSHKEEVYQYLMSIFFTTHNYKGALEVLESMSSMDAKQKAAYQEVAYYRGLELYGTKRYPEAIAHFQKSLTQPINRKTEALSHFWMGESWYKRGGYNEALKEYEQFTLVPGAFNLEEYPVSYYGSAYAFYKQQNYAEAITWFRRFVDDNRVKSKPRLNDAFLRIADGYYLNKDFYNALEYYGKAIGVGANDVDYAMYQKSMVLGVLSKYQEKIQILEQMLSKYPKSGFAAAAAYELANTYQTMNRVDDALAQYKKVESDYPGSVYVKDAILKGGLMQLQSGKVTEAQNAFEKVATEHYGSDAARQALKDLQDIYIERGNVDDFFDWLKEHLPGTSLEEVSQDSILYLAAENKYMKSDCAGAMQDFSSYLQRFPEGIFSVNAQFYRAECLNFIEDFDKARAGYKYVIGRPKNVFTEKSLRSLADIEFQQKKFDQALDYYRQLEKIAESQANRQSALVGQMRSLARLDQPAALIEAAQRVLAMEKQDVGLTVEAHLMMADGFYVQNELDKAYDEYDWVVKKGKSASAAKALYQMALIKHTRQDYKASETLIFQLIGDLTSYDEWVTKSLLLLAENYYQQGDMFQAKYTLQSIIDDYKGTELREKAIQRLQQLEEEEKAGKVKKEKEELEIELDPNANPPADNTAPNEEDHKDE